MLKPYNPAGEALKLAGILKRDNNSNDLDNLDASSTKVKEILDSHGASLDDAAAALSNALRDDDTNLQAARLAFQLHGALKEAETPTIPAINIQIITGDTSKNLLNFVMPDSYKEGE